MSSIQSSFSFRFRSIPCSACSHPLPEALLGSDQGGNCPFCGAHVEVKVFPAIAQAKFGAAPQNLGGDTEASCFYHERNRAVSHCAECGRFLCSLCELDISGKILCSACFGANLQSRKMQHLESSRTMHDSVALALATVPALLVWPTIITAPMAIYWTIRHWNSPRSVVPRTRIRFYFAILFALAQICLMVFVMYGFFLLRSRR